MDWLSNLFSAANARGGFLMPPIMGQPGGPDPGPQGPGGVIPGSGGGGAGGPIMDWRTPMPLPQPSQPMPTPGNAGPGGPAAAVMGGAGAGGAAPGGGGMPGLLGAFGKNPQAGGALFQQAMKMLQPQQTPQTNWMPPIQIPGMRGPMA